MQKNLFYSLAAVATVFAATSCSSNLGELSADYFKVTPTPLVLQNNQVQATIYGNFPEKYMAKKAVVKVTPELRGKNGVVVKGQGATFQGEKVNGNDQQISYLVGGHYSMREVFPYTDDLHTSDLYLTFDAKVGKKQIALPDVKVGYGVIATTNFYRKALDQAAGIEATDAFQRVTKEKYEASVKFLINQAQLRKSELKNNSVQEFVDLLARINKDAEGYNLKDIEILAAASPDGAEDYNEKLADKRQRASEKYVNEQLKKAKMNADITGQYTSEDWEGFQQLVAASDIQDKDLILRVLNLYKDPQEREQQIKNLSKGFRDLADNILPQLRRARMIINYEAVGRSDEQIAEQYKNDASQLSVEELLYLASTLTDNDAKEAIYKKAADLYPNDYRAFNNVAAMEMANGNVTAARNYIQKALAADPKNAEAQANLALVALQEGKIQEAETYLSKAKDCARINEVQGAIAFAKGNYKQAAEYLKGVNSNMAALAQIQAEDYAAARNTFKNIKNADATTDYLRGILSAREGNGSAAANFVKEALSKDSSLKGYAEGDLEFENVK